MLLLPLVIAQAQQASQGTDPLVWAAIIAFAGTLVTVLVPLLRRRRNGAASVGSDLQAAINQERQVYIDTITDLRHSLEECRTGRAALTAELEIAESRRREVEIERKLAEAEARLRKLDNGGSG